MSFTFIGAQPCSRSFFIFIVAITHINLSWRGVPDPGKSIDTISLAGIETSRLQSLELPVPGGMRRELFAVSHRRSGKVKGELAVNAAAGVNDMIA